MVLTLADAFLMGWRMSRERGQVAYMQNPNLTPHAIFSEMTMPARHEVAAILEHEQRDSPERK